MQMIKPTSLEKSSDIENTLTWKLSDIMEDGVLNAVGEKKLADYITRAVESLESKLDYVKYSKSIFTEEQKSIEKQIELIKLDGAKFLQENGIEKLSGVICSSITLTKEKEATTTDDTKKVFKALISEAEIEELLIGLGKAEMVTVTETKTTNYTPSKLKINKKKK